MTFTFEKLLVYQKAIDFADAICVATEQFTRGYRFLVDQLNRAALSISANIAEGNGRFTKPDRKNLYGIARGSEQLHSEFDNIPHGTSVAFSLIRIVIPKSEATMNSRNIFASIVGMKVPD